MAAPRTKAKAPKVPKSTRAQVLTARPAPAGGKSDPRVDAYIGKSRDFAKPILAHLRALVHKACPQAVETVKWGMPFFEHRGILAFMAAFKAHCGFGIWKGGRVVGAAAAQNREAMGHLGRITSLQDLPKDSVILAWVKAAAACNEAAAIAAIAVKAASSQSAQTSGKTSGKKDSAARSIPASQTTARPAPRPVKPVPREPDFFLAALKKNARAREAYAGFTPGKKREYLDWLIEAKTEETRMRRLPSAISWIAEGKERNWKYQRK